MKAAERAALCILAAMIGAAGVGDADAAYVDCRICHLDPAPDSAAQDYYEYFIGTRKQHPVGVGYPLALDPDYNQPTALSGDVAVFDTNGNGLADPDEIQLFGSTENVECSSCHREHGDSPPPPEPNMYLRFANNYDAICVTCHRPDPVQPKTANSRGSSQKAKGRP